jgi:leucyl/phenylalanyl-tRNA--protein transferase
MPIFIIDNKSKIPDVNLAEECGLLALSADITPEFTLKAYRKGIFPWPSDDFFIPWFSLDPRMIIYLDRFKVSHSLRRTIKSGKFTVKYDNDFYKTIDYCADINYRKQGETWIKKKIKDTFCSLYEMGYAHSVETYLNNKLVGGLYGVCIGKYFCGESMFHIERDASKVALYHLNKQLKEWGFLFIDAQQPTPHLKSLGGEEISRVEFTELLKVYSRKRFKPEKWNYLNH